MAALTESHPLRKACERVLQANDRGRYTVPSPRLYPHQWAWDSAFAAIGWAHVDPERSLTELDTLMHAQWDDGRVPHIVFHQPSPDYAPGPELWGAARSSTVSQPPVWPLAARRVAEIAGIDDRLEALLERFEASLEFFRRERDPLHWRLVAVAHPWESGLDNCPIWDEPLERVDRSAPPPFRRRDTIVTGDASMRPTDEQYQAYASLVRAIREDGFGPGPFAVYDPGFSAMLARAESDLAWLAERFGRRTMAERAHRRSRAIRRALLSRLWAPELGRFVYYDAAARQPVRDDVIGCYLPLCCGLPAEPQARLVAGLKQRYATRWPLPSTAPAEPTFEPRRYWRGPSWVNINWLVSTALAASGNTTEAQRTFALELSCKTVKLVANRGFWEYFHPDSGEGLGGEQFTWTAALILDLLSR